MTDNYSYTMISVDEISYDIENPRIKMALEKYGDQLTPDRIFFALRSAQEGTGGTSSFSSLRDSIRANGGVATPINVITKQGEKICIDGNTRLAIYKEFLKQGVDGDWSKIKAITINNADQRDIEKIRVSAHLVGAREWPAYEKARYLHYLRNQKFMTYDEMIALCGGNKTNIERQVDAYHDMNEYYRDIVDDDAAFHIDRFSGFVELQKQNIKDAIFEAGFTLKNFGEWIRDGKIYRLADVRQLPKVLCDDEAKKLFLEGGPRSIENAIKLVQKKEDESLIEMSGKLTLESATVYQLAEFLMRRVNELPYSEVRALSNREHSDADEHIRIFEDLSDRLKNLIEDVSE